MEYSLSSSRQTPARQATPGAPAAPSVRDQVRQTLEDVTNAANDAERAANRNGAPVIAGGSGDRSVTIRTGPGGVQITRQGEPVTIVRGRDFPGSNDVPPQIVDISIGFFVMCAVIAIGWPLARAFGRRLERRPDVSSANPMIADQLQRIEQAVEAMSIEVERISESQRFLTRLQSGATSADAAPLSRQR